MKRFLTWLPPYSLTVVVSVLILYLTLVPKPLPDTDLELFPHADKVVHGIMFGALAGALALDRARRRGIDRLTPRFLAVCFVASTVAGGAIELIQGGMAMGRGCDVWDFAADAAGALLAVLVVRSVARWLLGVRR